MRETRAAQTWVVHVVRTVFGGGSPDWTRIRTRVFRQQRLSGDRAICPAEEGSGRLSPQPATIRVRIGHMPPPSARLGDVYWVFRGVTRRPGAFGSKKSRPCCCVDADPPDEDVWTAMSRLTTGMWKSDIPSAANPSIGLDRVGVWSARFIHQVLRSKTGSDACRYLGALEEDERNRVLACYERLREPQA